MTDSIAKNPWFWTGVGVLGFFVLGLILFVVVRMKRRSSSLAAARSSSASRYSLPFENAKSQLKISTKGVENLIEAERWDAAVSSNCHRSKFIQTMINNSQTWSEDQRREFLNETRNLSWPTEEDPRRKKLQRSMELLLKNDPSCNIALPIATRTG